MQQKETNNSDSTKNLEHEPGAPIVWMSSTFLETSAKLLIKSKVKGRRKRRGKNRCRWIHSNYDSLNKSVFMMQIHTSAEGMFPQMKRKLTIRNERSSRLIGQYFSFTIDLYVLIWGWLHTVCSILYLYV